MERLGPKDKLNIISEQLGIDIDYGIRPWQVMKKLFKFRNDIAHGKTKDIKSSYETPLNKHSDEKFGELIRSEWEKYCTKENAERSREDIEKIIYLIYEAGSFENDYPFTQGFQFGGATEVPS